MQRHFAYLLCKPDIHLIPRKKIRFHICGPFSQSVSVSGCLNISKTCSLPMIWQNKSNGQHFIAILIKLMKKKLTLHTLHAHSQVFVTQKRHRKISNHELTFRIWTVLKSIICIWIPGIWSRCVSLPRLFSRNTQKSICSSIMLASWPHHTTSRKMALKVNSLSTISGTSS